MPFEITNGVMNGESVWIVAATNGVSFVFETNKVEVWLGTMTSASLWYDPQKAVFKKFLLDIKHSDGKQQWISDLNADGVPDTRRKKGNFYSEAFMNGEWVPFAPGDGTYANAVTRTQQFKIFHDGTRWVRMPESKSGNLHEP
ncbi:MAG: hypothetical protein HYY24_06370 [Verrucomicrobia bacterium]|nr:hypothetical protein [Verrucomicrobiota bacterium]